MVGLAIPVLTILSVLQAGEYTGRFGCQPCHGEIFERHQASHMSQAAFVAGSHPLAGKVLEKPVSVGNTSFRFLQENQNLLLEASNGRQTRRIAVQWAFGRGAHGVTFISQLAGDLYLEHRLSYYPELDGLDITPGQALLPDQTLLGSLGRFNNPVEALRCFRCHNTAVNLDRMSGQIDIGELGVQCEACHGPGGRHVEAVGSGNLESAISLIRSFRSASAGEVVSFCGNCHRMPLAPGQILDWQDPVLTRFQPVGLSQSQCFLQSQSLSCLSCHDPHESARRNDPGHYNSRCASCHHSVKLPPALICRADSKPNCIDCHMPKVTALPHLTFTNHWIGVYGANKLQPKR